MHLRRSPIAWLTLLPLLGMLGGCPFSGGEPPEVTAARKEAEGKAVGGACRHAGRAIEDCFALNKRADKAALFAGWREMNDCMRENKIEVVAPQGGVLAEAAPEKTGEPAVKADKGEKVKKGDEPKHADKPEKADAAAGEEPAAKKAPKSKKHDG